MEDEFYLNEKDAKRRQRRRQKARDEAVYGVFGEDQDDSPSGKRREASYTKPVGFVGAGTMGDEEQEHVQDQNLQIQQTHQPAHAHKNEFLHTYYPNSPQDSLGLNLLCQIVSLPNHSIAGRSHICQQLSHLS